MNGTTVPKGDNVSTEVSQQPMRASLVETTGIEIIQESERTAKPLDLFWPWFAANVSVFGMSYGAFVLGFGVSFWQAILVSLVGIVVSFMLCGFVAIAGKRGSAPTMVLSRAAFGVHGQKVPGIVSWLTSMGWETVLAILAVLATSTVFARLGWSSGVGTKVIATVVVAAMIVGASVLGYHTIMRLQSVLTWVTGAITILYMALTFRQINWAAVAALPSGSPEQVLGALTMVMTGFGLGWINIAADWSRYQRRDASGAQIVWWNTLGGSLAPVFLVTFGLLLAGSHMPASHTDTSSLFTAISADPVGALAGILPLWVLIPFWLSAVLALISGAFMGIYSSGLTLLSLGIKVPRTSAALIDGAVLTLGTVWVVFFAGNFLMSFQSFLLILGVPLAASCGILLADIALRRKPYDEAALFDAHGRYGCVDWVSLITMGVLTLLGWGLVTNTFATDASTSWNNWLGYLLGPLGLGGREGAWAYANIGVLLALVIGFAITYVARRSKVRSQEADDVRD